MKRDRAKRVQQENERWEAGLWRRLTGSALVTLVWDEYEQHEQVQS